MMFADPSNLLLTVVLAISGWNLLETIRLGKTTEAMRQKMRDLPCSTNGTSGKRCHE